MNSRNSRASIVTGSKLTIAVPASVLRMKAQPVPEKYFGSDMLTALVTEMWACMIEAGGVGIAAPQVGISWRLFLAHSEGVMPPTVFVNPEITTDGSLENGEEGCLSVPGLRSSSVPRFERVFTSYTDMWGSHHEQIFEGYAARIVQHEFDHIEGKLYLDHGIDTYDDNAIMRRAEKAMATLLQPRKGNTPDPDSY